MPSHYLNQCWNVVNSNCRNKLQWNLKQNSYIFTQENAFENVVCEMSDILSQPQCVNARYYRAMMMQFIDIGNGLRMITSSLVPQVSLSHGFHLTHWGRVTHICVGNLTIIGSDNGSAPGRRPAITWTNVGILLIGPLGTNFSETLIEIRTFSFKKIHLKCLLENGGHFASALKC